jgi:hypothetical protein
MKIRHALALLVASMAAATIAAGPASAATTGNTIVTFTVSPGALAITVPATAALGSGAPGTTIAAQIGAVQVTDARAQLTTSWTASVVATNFTTGGATTAETIPSADVSYWSGPATASTGNGTLTPGELTAADALPLSATVPITAFSLTAGTGNNSVTWNPTLSVAVPLTNAAGAYSGTVTHSVA